MKVAHVAVLCNLVALVFFLIALPSTRWVTQEIKLPNHHNPVIGRGLFEAYMDNGNGVAATVEYFAEDALGRDLDPFCGDGGAPSPFLSIFSEFTAFFEANNLFSNSRDNDSNNWCHVRNTCIAFMPLAAFLALLAGIFDYLAEHHAVTWVLGLNFVLGAAISSVVVSIVFGTWLSKEEEDRQDRNKGVEGIIDPGFAFILVFLGATLEIIALTLLVIVNFCMKPDPEMDPNPLGQWDPAGSTAGSSTYKPEKIPEIDDDAVATSSSAV